MSRLYYTHDAGWDWNNALPVGNGKLGAMIFGGSYAERLQLNEDSLWTGGKLDRINKDALPNLDKVRNLIFEGKIPEAEELILHSFSGNPPSQRPYSPLGELYISYKDIKSDAEEYYRELDLSESVHRVVKKCNGVKYIEEIIASYPKNVIAINIKTEDNTPFNVDIDGGRMCFYDKAEHDDKNIYFYGNLPGKDYNFCGGYTAYAKKGSVELTGQYIVCKEVVDLTILISAATSYREANPIEYVKKILNKASDYSYDLIKAEHIKDYKSLYDNTRLNLEYDDALDSLPTDERLNRINEEVSDNGLVNTYFDFGRYLLISSSRIGSLPANLQGVWNKDLDPPWGCKFTININTQMNYWPAEILGLSDCHEALFDHMLTMIPSGRQVAKEMYGCRGIVCHHNTDLWGDCAPQDLWIPGTYWIMSIPWLCTHIMNHYEYTRNVDFLRKMYDFVKESVLFFHDFLIEKDNQAIICPSVSPENTYILPTGVKGSICYNSSMDVEILRDHFTNYLKMYKIVGDNDKAFYDETERLLSELPPIKVGKHGQIMEWVEDYDEAEPGHRHISQLYALHPSHQITVSDTPDLAAAADATIKRRLSYGGGHTGWSRAWIMNMYARLWKGEDVYKNLILLFKHSTLGNLFDNHPPFQIDGNFGSVAAIGEAFVQAYDDKVYLMPAVGGELKSGEFVGIKLPGKASISLRFKDGKLLEYIIKAGDIDYSANVIYENISEKIMIKAGESVKKVF